GLTIAMIGLIMFILSLQAALNTNFSKAFLGADAQGGFDDRILVNGNNRSPDAAAFVASLQAANQQPDTPEKVDVTAIAKIGEVRSASPLEVDIADPAWAKEDPATRKPEDQYRHYALLGVDQGFVDAQQIPLKYRAAGYADDAAVWAALATDPRLAIIPAALTQPNDGFGGPPSNVELLELDESYTSEAFQPFGLTVRDRTTGQDVVLTVIGQAKEAAGVFWPGIFVGKEMVTATFPDSRGQEFFVSLRPGADARQFARAVESALVQASADATQKIIDDNQAQNRTFLEMFQGFLALGLFVGIAALGVISFRAVVERRQQIGMLRAIGYQRRMVQLSFLFESGFIALSGIVLGLVLGLTFAWNLFSSGEFGDTTQGLSFTVPWLQVLVVTAFAFTASMLMTWLPARAASRVAVAEALRYE
ncbi:MAG: ABC transporter permease, partial [Dehalococcoidia bacterium]|nr:ABC transporter permease [Dehalococcoidia bacterium]